MLTTRFEELRMSEDESFDSFYGKLNEVVIGKFNLGEKTEDSKVVRKILRSLLKSFRAQVIAIEESKDLDDIKVQDPVGSLQTYELSLPTQRKSKSLALKTINERIEAHDSSDEDVVEKDVAYLAKNSRKFLKFKNSGKFGDKGKFTSSGKEKKDFKKRDGKESQSNQGVTCFECNGHGPFKKECSNYLKSKGKVYATTLSDSDSSTSDSEDSCDEEGNLSAFMTIAHVESSEDLNLFVQELGEHSDEESMGIVEESNTEEDEDADRATLILEENLHVDASIGMQNMTDTDEVKGYLNCRYVSTIEACWMIFEFEIHYQQPVVQRLSFHIENQQPVVFKDTEYLDNIIDRPDITKSKFTEWMKANELYEEARELTYS